MRVVLRLVVFVKRHWVTLLLAFISMIAMTAFQLVVPRLLGDAIDTAVSAGERTTLVIYAVAIVVVAALRGAAGFGNRYFGEVFSQKMSYDIRNAIYDKLQRLSFSYYDKRQTGEIMSRGTVDVEAVRMFFANGMTTMLQMIFMIVGVSVIMITMNWQLALMTLAFMPFIAWRANVISTILQPIWLKIQEIIAAMGATLQESLMGVRIVKAFNRQKEESRKFSDRANTLYDYQINVARVRAINIPIMNVLIGIPVAIILWYGGRQIINGNLTLGDVSAFIIYLGMLSMPVRRVGFIATMLSRTVSAGQRIVEIFDTESAVQEKPGAIQLEDVKGAVTFENVTFSYDSTGNTLEDINFSVEPGQTVALLGGSGSGKSTISSLLSRFYDVKSGRILIDGIDIRDVTLSSLRNNVVAAQQDIFLFSDTIKNNIAYGDIDATNEQIETVAKAARLHDFVASLPDGYDTWVGERGFTLSGGERQRLAIARTLLLNPKVLILDDSTSSVDAQTEHLIRQALDKLIQGRTTFIITHRLPIIKNADLILMLKDGKIIERGKHSELMALKGVYYTTYQAQLVAEKGLEDNQTEE